jgi:ParB-like chromosome segregation protein Spo0J
MLRAAASNTPPEGNLMSLPGILDPWREIIHPAALILPRPNDNEYSELKNSIEARGVLTPLATYVDKKGEHWLLDGVSRLQVMVELDKPILDDAGRWAVPTTPYYEEQGADPYEIALSLNVTRRHLTPEQKREVIRQLRQDRPELSDRAVARMAGVSPHTVGEVRHEAEDRAEEPAEEQVDPETGEITVREPETGEGDDNVTHIARGVVQEPRQEETGRRARGRQPVTPTQRRRPRSAPDANGEDVDAKPFVGTILPTANKTARIAEAKRCVKHLGLVVTDLISRRRVAA